jgi:ribosomal protein S18 acetylase RimI-like enzyme
MDGFRVRPMSADEFAELSIRLVRDYAADHMKAGNWSPKGAEGRAADELAQLLPEGVDTTGVLLLTGETAEGEPVGFVWVGLERRPGGRGGAWIYNIEILPEQRGKGFGRALLAAAEVETAERGVTAIGLNVFGPNATARNLYESAGYEVATLQMRKELHPPS